MCKDCVGAALLSRLQCAPSSHAQAHKPRAGNRSCFHLFLQQEVGDISTKDWRTQRMAEAVERLYDRVWNQGDLELISQLVSTAAPITLGLVQGACMIEIILL